MYITLAGHIGRAGWRDWLARLSPSSRRISRIGTTHTQLCVEICSSWFLLFFTMVFQISRIGTIHNSAWNFFLSYLFFTMLFQISRIGTTYTEQSENLFFFYAHIGLKRQFSQFVKSWQKRLFCLFVVFVLEYFYSPGNWVHILKDDITCENKISVIIFTNTEPSGCCSCKNKFTEMSAI